MVVDARSFTKGVEARESAEVGHDPVLEQKSVRLKESVGGGFADDPAAVVDATGAAAETAGEGAEIFDGKGLTFGGLRRGAAENGKDGKNQCNRETPADSLR